MKIMEITHSEVLEVRRGGGVLIVFGLPFFLVGFFFLLVMTGVVPMDSNPPPPMVGILFGGIFGSVGLGLMLGRAGIIIDKRHGTVTKWWGILVRCSQKVRPLADFKDVALSKEIRRSKTSTYTVYPVRLERDGKDRINIGETRDYPKSRAVAEQVAAFVELPVVDSSTGTEVRRQADQLDVSLRDQLKTQGTLELPEPPAAMRSQIRQRNSTVMIEIPPPAFNPAFFGVIAVVGVGVVIGPVVMFLIFAAQGDGGPPLLFLLIFFVIMVLVPLSVGFRLVKSRGPTRVYISPTGGIRTERKKFGGLAKQEIPANELEELVLNAPSSALRSSTCQEVQVPPFVASILKSLGQGGGSLTARSDTMTLTFGGGLDEEELAYLHGVICQVIAQ